MTITVREDLEETNKLKGSVMLEAVDQGHVTMSIECKGIFHRQYIILDGLLIIILGYI